MKHYLFTIEEGVQFIVSTEKEIENCVEEVSRLLNKQFSHEVEVKFDEHKGFIINGYMHVYYTELEMYVI